MHEVTKQTSALLRPKVWALTLLLATLTPALAFAEGEALSQSNANLLWTLIAAILVMFMQAGFALVEMGFARAKNAGNILMKNLLDFAAGQPALQRSGAAVRRAQAEARPVRSGDAAGQRGAFLSALKAVGRCPKPLIQCYPAPGRSRS